MSEDQVQVTRIRLETSSLCQLKCPSCPTARGEIRHSVVGSGRLRAGQFESLLDENPTVRSVELSNWGEIFLNPDIDSILRIAFERGVRLKASNGANLNNVRDETLVALVRYRLTHLTCSIDGASQETYSQYRRGGDYNVVLANVRRLVDLKSDLQSPFPRLTWQFVVFGHNEHEIPEARALAHSLGMEFRPKLSWDESFSPVRDPKFVRLETGIGAASRSEYRTNTATDYRRSVCLQLWKEPQINFDGTLLGCCVNRWGSFGNVFEEGLAGAVNGERMRHARAMLTGQAPSRPDVPCTSCSRYVQMQRTGAFLGENDWKVI